MRCPSCGENVKDRLAAFCPICGKELPRPTREERRSALDRSVAGVTLVVSLVLLFLGLSLLLPDVIIHYIGGGTLYWPYQMYMIVVGVALLVVRHPFARRARLSRVQLLRSVQAQWTCSYCGKDNRPGLLECESCGAPLKKT